MQQNICNLWKKQLLQIQMSNGRFVVFHHSIYSAASHSLEASIIKFREDLVPTIDELDIDVVLIGT